MARGVRNPRIFPSRRSSPYTLILAVLLMLSLVLLMLLALGILSLPLNSDDAPKADRRVDRSIYETDGEAQRGVQWTEVLSWEPRAFIYHNLLGDLLASVMEMLLAIILSSYVVWLFVNIVINLAGCGVWGTI